VVDTPGLREVGLLGTSGGLARAFADVETLAESCRFDDCGHQSEPGCAVRAALDSGELAVRRYESWTDLRRESGRKAGRNEARLRRVKRTRTRRPRDDRGAGQA
jgi:ribosome biogenesis GTPase